MICLESQYEAERVFEAEAPFPHKSSEKFFHVLSREGKGGDRCLSRAGTILTHYTSAYTNKTPALEMVFMKLQDLCLDMTKY